MALTKFLPRPSTRRKRYLLLARHLADAFEAGEAYTMMCERSGGPDFPDKVAYLVHAVPELQQALDDVHG